MQVVELNDQIRTQLEELLTVIPASKLQSVGLAMFYLLTTPSLDPNQCVPAAAALRSAKTRYGAKCEVVPVTVQVSWDGIVRGSAMPSVQRDGTTNGHFVIVTENDEFIDPTALQFDDLVARRGASGFMPMVGRQPGIWSQVAGATRGSGTSIAEAAFHVGEQGDHVIYNLFSPHAASPVIENYMSLNASKNLTGWQESMADLFAWMVGNHILTGRRGDELSQIDDQAFAAAVKGWLGKPQPDWQQTSAE